ncbi:tetratricopeptide repeat protein [Nitratiruptor sp. SB155-2]|uniref:tetratricopeptide repeat protein n=1 Tax=Nitratiruptor sp. (strain SB155-2) TaxID=387092 RepID=UPI0002F6A90E|nr:SEL1-like repeat protein [Nitratiruptor sp. SB155-2]
MIEKAVDLFENDKYDEALPIFKKLAKEGDAEAMYYLGMMYYEGWGVEKDEKMAVEWWKKANRRGSLDAKYMLQTICATSSVFARE